MLWQIVSLKQRGIFYIMLQTSHLCSILLAAAWGCRRTLHVENCSETKVSPKEHTAYGIGAILCSPLWHIGHAYHIPAKGRWPLDRPLPWQSPLISVLIPHPRANVLVIQQTESTERERESIQELHSVTNKEAARRIKRELHISLWLTIHSSCPLLNFQHIFLLGIRYHTAQRTTSTKVYQDRLLAKEQ